MISENKKKAIKLSVFITVIAIVILTAVFVVIRYEVEGETNMPFNVGKIIIISSAVTEDANNMSNSNNLISESTTETVTNGDMQNTVQEPTTDGEGTNNLETAGNDIKEEQAISNEEPEESYIWNEKVIQTNDIYVYIDQNPNYKKEAIIKNIRIENIQILNKAELGKIQAYMPNSLEGDPFNYTNDYIIGQSLTYNGALTNNLKTLEIGNQGGHVALSFANIDLGNYKSNEDEQLEQGAQILEQMGITDENLNFKISFDLIIDVGSKSYKGTYTLDLPVKDLVGNKEAHTEITDFEGVVFKRNYK